MGLTITLDFNRCISKDCAGWKESFNMPLDDFVDYPKFRESRPDFTDPEVREWFWETIYSATAKKQFPVDGLWIDEFDSHRTMPYDTKLYTRNWASESNYYYYLIGKSLHEEVGNQILPTKDLIYGYEDTPAAQKLGLYGVEIFTQI